MGLGPWLGILLTCLGFGLHASLPVVSAAASASQATASATPASAPPIDIKADRIDYLKELEVYEAEGSVVITQGALRLTSDHATIRMLPGTLVATGHVHLSDPRSDVEAERMELDVNTEAGVISNGQLYIKPTNSTIIGRLLQRFSEDHYRGKDGSFTNCDVGEGIVPAWRLRFEDSDLNIGDSIGVKNAWLCVNDVPVIPMPALTYPLSVRRSGFLIPTVGYDNRFGMHLQQSYFWAISPSQDMTISPSYFSSLGYGSDLDYRYVLDRKSRGQWYVSFLQQTELPDVAGVDQTSGDAKQPRALLSGTHTQQINPDLLLRVQAFLVTDPNDLQQLSNSGAQRALPSGESSLLGTRRLPYGNLYMLGQYLQPLQSGGNDTFQRLPELGYSLANTSPFEGPFLFGLDSNFVNFYRDEGFTVNRVDVVPAFSTDVLDVGHIVGFTPQIKGREAYYTRGAQTESTVHRETFWAALDATSKLTRRLGLDDGGNLLHTIEPSVIYEYVPQTDQSKIAQIDQVDDLPKKNLMTYSLHSRLLERTAQGSTFNWLDLTLAQSYRVGGVQTRARDFTSGIVPPLGTITQPLQPATVPIQGKRFSDLWMRATIGNNIPQLIPASSAAAAFGRGSTAVLGTTPAISQYLTVDAFLDPYRGALSQWNTDVRVQDSNRWYLEIGQRYTRDGNRVRRGDIWNPISFNEVYAPTPEIQFVTAGGAFKTPFGWTVGAKAYYDVKNGKSPEYDVVALYQNPCKCWSLGLYYLQFPDRAQYNFMLSLTGLGWTENFGTAVVRSILSPILVGERGLPWAAPGGPYGRPQQPISQIMGSQP
ncbi:MAG: LPS-assembly protein LptD [Nitrospiraceae bacterium]